jgi:hypothetical protein
MSRATQAFGSPKRQDRYMSFPISTYEGETRLLARRFQQCSYKLCGTVSVFSIQFLLYST